ncbi:MAG: YggS family pyridoxal phosphate-dependent enzyme [Myxococcota bacterium]
MPNDLERIIEQIKAACQKSQRSLTSVKLLAVSKNQPIQKIEALYTLGQRDFGENYAEELDAKLHILKERLKDIRWHFIGQIQSNKIRLIAQADMVHSLANLKHAELLAKHTPHSRLPVLLQVNLSGEPHRGGVPVSQLAQMADAIASIPRLDLKGFMAILPLGTPHPPAYWFAQMQALQTSQWPELSMGMSEDYEEAIMHGATWVRIGSALFSKRS